MIESVWVKNQNGDYLELNLVNSGEQYGIYVVNIEGLGSPATTVNGVGGPNFDGIQVNSVRADSRHLVLSVAVSGSGLIEQVAREKLYKYFPIKQNILFGLNVDGVDLEVPAFVEQNEMNHFSKVVNSSISLLAPNPYWRHTLMNEVYADINTGIPLFQFPFSNESLTEPLIEFGMDVDIITISVPYDGVATGCQMGIELLGDVEDIVIANNNGSQVMTLDLTYALAYHGSPSESGDKIYLDTRVGSKSAWYVRDDDWFNMINGIGLFDPWIEIRPGGNMITFTATTGNDLMAVDLWYRRLREGV